MRRHVAAQREGASPLACAHNAHDTTAPHGQVRRVGGCRRTSSQAADEADKATHTSRHPRFSHSVLVTARSPHSHLQHVMHARPPSPCRLGRRCASASALAISASAWCGMRSRPMMDGSCATPLSGRKWHLRLTQPGPPFCDFAQRGAHLRHVMWGELLPPSRVCALRRCGGN
eukprot:235552-Chlamydomonas_euryale.AAC.2